MRCARIYDVPLERLIELLDAEKLGRALPEGAALAEVWLDERRRVVRLKVDGSFPGVPDGGLIPSLPLPGYEGFDRA